MNKTQTKKLRKALFHMGTPSGVLGIFKSSIGLWWVGREDWGMWQTGYGQYHLTADEAIEAALNGERPERIRPWKIASSK
jgi:hypothetical protein